jgi:hypothetical protein
LSIVRLTETRAAPKRGATDSQTLSTCLPEPNRCNFPAIYRDKKANPAKDKLACPLRKLVKPSFKIELSDWWHIATEERPKGGSTVPGSGWQRSRISGRGRPTVIVATCVKAPARERERTTGHGEDTAGFQAIIESYDQEHWCAHPIVSGS